MCEVDYPNTSAYSIHVVKMCDAFSNYTNLNLFVPSSANAFNKIKKNYNLKNKFNFKTIFKKKKKINFISKINFSLKILNQERYKKNVQHLYVSRSIIFAIFSTILRKKTILEIHHNLTGFTKIIFYSAKLLGLLNNLKYIFIHKNLLKIFKVKKNDYICLDDAVNIEDFKKYKKPKKLKKTCVYVGSFHKGKGLELIQKISKKLSNINFHLYGDKKFLENHTAQKNIKVFGFINYKDVPKILSNYNIALMPYGNSILGRIKKVNLVNYISPLKMFDYLASQNIILASNLNVYSHILKHKKNSILIKNSNINLWCNWINKIFKTLKKYEYIKVNAYSTAKNYTWDKRAKKIIKFSESFLA